MALIDLVVTLGVLTGVYAIMAIGLHLHWGDTGLMNLAHAAFFGVGAYTSVILTTPPRKGAVFNRTVGLDLPVVVGLVGAAVVAGIAGVLIAITSVRVEDDYLAVVSLGLAEIINLIVANEGWLTGGVQGVSNVKDAVPKSMPIPPDYAYFGLVGLTLILTYTLFHRLSSSPFGRVLNAVREDEKVPMALGKSTTIFKLKSFGLGAAVAGLAGGLWAHFANALTPELLSANLTFLILTAVILGGVGSYLGAIVGTILLMGLFQSVQYLPEGIPLGDQLAFIRMIVIGVVLILVIYYRPYGLLGDRERMLAGHSGGEE